MQVDLKIVIKQMMAIYNVEVTEVAYPYDTVYENEYFHLRKQYRLDFDDFIKNLKNFFKRLSLNNVTLIEDVLGICHLVFVVPDTLNCIMIGPFRTKELDQNIIDKLHLDADKIVGLKKTLITFPMINDTLINLNLIPVISTGFDKEKFEVHHYTEEVPKIFLPDSELFYGKQVGEEERMLMLEERYHAENQMLKAVSEGNAQKALEFMSKMGGREVAERFSFSLRSQKNSLIIFNSLIRKSIEKAGVHPYYIDEISTRYSNMIELVMDNQEFFMMMKMMIQEYCDYVLKYGGNQYSLLVQKMVQLVNAEITSALSLSTIAKKMNMNASYLSNLFKRETGMTITYFINQQKVRQAAEYLKESQISIAQVSERVGIHDVNYFARIFKKHLGMSPSDFRKNN